MSLRSRSHVKASMVLTRADHLCIHNYIRSLLNNILRPILMVRRYNNGLYIGSVNTVTTNMYLVWHYSCLGGQSVGHIARGAATGGDGGDMSIPL